MKDLLRNIHKELNIQESHLAANKLSRCEQPPLLDLEVAEIDFEGKPFVLTKNAAPAWRKMRHAAENDSIQIEPFSGFRSYIHQRNLIRRKLEKGRHLEMILTETAIPGYSEHHTGCAVDICTDGTYRLTEDFEKTPAFHWLNENAKLFQFRLSYPQSNDKGIIFEPWHWFFFG